MHLGDDSFRHGSAERGVTFPVVMVDPRDDGARSMHAAVARREFSIAGRAFHGRYVSRGAVEAFGVGIDQQLVGIKIVARFRIPGAVDSVAIGAAGRDTAHGDVIDVAG